MFVFVKKSEIKKYCIFKGRNCNKYQAHEKPTIYCIQSITFWTLLHYASHNVDYAKDYSNQEADSTRKTTWWDEKTDPTQRYHECGWHKYLPYKR